MLCSLVLLMPTQAILQVCQSIWGNELFDGGLYLECFSSNNVVVINNSISYPV